jgi:hypothetical protein
VNHDDGASANQVTSAMILDMAKIRITNNTTVMFSDLPNRHKLHGQIGNKKNIKDMKKIRTKSVLSSNKKREIISNMNSTMAIRRS